MLTTQVNPKEITYTSAHKIPAGTADYTLVGIPSECPICRTQISPIFRTATTYGNWENVDCSFQCPNTECQRLFISRYRGHSKETVSGIKRQVCSIHDVLPLTYLAPEIPDEVASLSDRFVEVYTQALHAESLGLDQVFGMALRKALEFLLKDFASLHGIKNASPETIAKMPLGNVIAHHIGSPQLKTVAERATWLGNDQTHYVRKYKLQDIEDLKVLVRLSINWIWDVILTINYTESMNRSGSVKPVQDQ